MSIAIHWFRRDLRLTDNTALNAAARHDQIVPVYILSHWEKKHHWCGAPRQEFLCGCLQSLAKNLENKGGRLIVRQGAAEAVLQRLVQETGADVITFNRDPDPFGRQVEERVCAMAGKLGVRVEACQDIALHERNEILTATGSPYRVFTPYARAWTKLEKPAPGRTITRVVVPPKVESEPLPTLATWGLQSDALIVDPGESIARRRWGRFLDGPIFEYATLRDIPADEGTSRISQDLRFGTLSIREVYSQCAALAKRHPAKRHGIEVFINELIWREFYMQVLWHCPEVLDREYQEDCRELGWRDHWRPEQRDGGTEFQRWCNGLTGFPIVDAGMRQLNATGFLHNRVRMIVAMFLTKDLRVWWMHGESWFMQRLVDGEIASNNGGWQWSASTGTDAAPYFRIQNPWSQSKRFDPKGLYIKRWVPELRDVHHAHFHSPPNPALPLARGYPLPMVDHQVERDHALAMFRT